MDQTEAGFRDNLTEYGIRLSEAVFQQSCAFIKLLLEANQTVNLTAITDYEEALYKHLLDSLLVTKLPVWEKASRIIDIGAGAGVPAIPLAIAFPEKVLVTLEATQKKVSFQQQARETLKLNNLTPLWGRAEEFGKKTGHREQYDLVLARAVSAVNVLAELTIPFAKPVTGVICFYKGKDYQAELEAGRNAIRTLGGKVTDVVEKNLPREYGARSFIVIHKNQPTPAEFPRRTGIPQKKPL